VHEVKSLKFGMNFTDVSFFVKSYPIKEPTFITMLSVFSSFTSGIPEISVYSWLEYCSKLFEQVSQDCYLLARVAFSAPRVAFLASSRASFVRRDV